MLNLDNALIFLDGKKISTPLDSLCVPHRHQLGIISPGKHRLVICIDNRMIHPIGNKNHAYGEQTQSRWNGIVGRIELIRQSKTSIDSLRVFSYPWSGSPQ